MLSRIKEDIQCVFARDPAAQSVFEIVTTYPGFHAILMHRFSHRLWCAGFRWPARFLSYLTRWWTGIEIHPGAQIGRRFFIDHGMGVVIGETATIGDDCTLYHGVTLGGTSWNKGRRHPTLEDGVVIGAGAKVLGAIVIGKDSRIGSNSVVVKPVPPGVTVVGIPAHSINDKSKQQVSRDEMAQKFGFDAYGAMADMPDPISNTINAMLDHIHQMDRQLEVMRQTLLDAGIDCKAEELSLLDDCQLRDKE